MGRPLNKLYAMNTNDPNNYILISGVVPIKKDDNYYMPNNTIEYPYMWVPNILDLTIDETTQVEVVESDIETGLWIVIIACETYLYNFKPIFKGDTKILDAEKNTR